MKLYKHYQPYKTFVCATPFSCGTFCTAAIWCLAVHLLIAVSFNSLPSHTMFSLNRVHLIGYQTQPIQVRQTPSGTSVTDMNLVTPYRFQSDNGQWIEGKNFHTVTVCSAMADVV